MTLSPEVGLIAQCQKSCNFSKSQKRKWCCRVCACVLLFCMAIAGMMALMVSPSSCSTVKKAAVSAFSCTLLASHH
eukprot:756357-Amphidinium_carterae.1